MDYHLSCTSPLPWIWVVEALALSNQVNVSLLLDFLEATPEKSNNLGSNARELISLRVLESLFVQGTRANPDPPSSVSSEKISLNPSDCCEDVLRQILTKSSSHLKFAGLEMSKWDLQPFIEHKRSNLGKYVLQELKDAILRESHSFPTSFKEQSGLQIANQPDLMPEDLLNQNFVPTSRKTRAMSGKADEVSFETLILPHMKPPKKLKTQGDREGFCDPQRTDKDKDNESMSQRDMQNVGDEVEEAVNISNDTDRNNDARDKNVSANASKTDSVERCSLEKETHVERMGQNGPPADGNSNNCGAEVLSDKFDGGQREDREVGNESGDKIASQDKDKFDQSVSMNVQSANKAEHVDISNDSDGFDDDETSIDTKKMAFLSSQCTYSQDSLAREWGELCLCVKCNKGGKLLVCSSDSCSLMIHDSCLGLDACYDMVEKFYCPFCAYSQAISKFTDTKKKASSARKDLTTFICLETKGHSHLPCRNAEYHLEQDDGLPRTRHSQRKKELENDKAGPSKLSTGRVVNSPIKAKKVGKRRRQVSQSLQVYDEHQVAARAIHKSRDENDAAFQISRSMKAITYYPETDIRHKNKGPSSSQSVNSEEMFGKEAEDETSCHSKYRIRAKKQKKQVSYAEIQLRRVRLPWSSAEEDILKEGVRLLSSPHEAMPWTRILEFGTGIFQKNRTTVDLKDKWRNMCKTSPIVK